MKAVFHTDAEVASDATVLTVDGKSYSLKELPESLDWLSGTTHGFEIPPQIDVGDGTRLVFTSWMDGDVSTSRVISNGGEYTAHYKTQYKLTVQSPYGSPRGSGWYDSGSKATVSIHTNDGNIIQHTFIGWSGDFTGPEANISLIVDKAKTIKANWRTDYLRFYLLILVPIVVVIGTITWFMLRKKKPV